MYIYCFNLLVCCDRCKTSFFHLNESALYNYNNVSGELKRLGVLYNCPDCNHVGITSEWIRLNTLKRI